MRVLLITEGLGSGGAERQICGLARMFVKQGIENKLITYSRANHFEPLVREAGVDYEYHPELLPRVTRVLRLLKILYKYKPTTIISYLPSVNITTCIARMFYRCNLIVSDRNVCTEINWKVKIQYLLYRFAQYVIPNSYTQGKFIEHHFPSLKKKIYPIINFVDSDRFTPQFSDVLNEPVKIVTVARYTHAKNTLKFMEVVRMAKNLRLNVYFDWYGNKEHDTEYYAQVEAKYNEMDIADYMMLHTSCTNIEEVYRKSDVLCLPSLWEGYPNVIVEAMASGLPVICSNIYENPYIIEDGVGGFLFNPEEPEDILRTIVRIENMTLEARRRMGLHNRQLCLERNSESAFVDAYIRLLV